MKSSNRNTSLSTDQSKPSQQNVLERVADRSTKKTFFKKKTWFQFMFGKKVIDYKNPEMLSKFTSENGRILSLKNKQIILKKNKQTYVQYVFS
jgi:ribosomal protein S18